MNRSFSAVRGALALLILLVAFGPSARALGTPEIYLIEATPTSITIGWQYQEGYVFQRAYIAYGQSHLMIREIGSQDDCWATIENEDPRFPFLTLDINNTYTFFVVVNANTMSDDFYATVAPHAPEIVAPTGLDIGNWIDIFWTSNDPVGFDGWFDVRRAITSGEDDPPDEEDFISLWFMDTYTYSCGEYFFFAEEADEELKTYWYQVVGLNWFCVPSLVNDPMPVTFDLFAPALFNGQRSDSSTINLWWYDYSFKDTSYVIERATSWQFNPGDIVTLTVSDSAGTSGMMDLNDDNAPATRYGMPVHYWYRIHAYRADGDKSSLVVTLGPVY